MRDHENKRFAVIAVQMLCGFALSAFAAGAAMKIHLTSADAGKTITAKVGDTIGIELDGNITTGYSWTTNSFNAAVLKLEGEPEYRSLPPRMPGSGGTFLFRFQARAGGTSTVSLVYRRPWGKDVPPAQEFKATIIVK